MAHFIKKMMPGKHHTDMSLGLNHLRKLFAEFRHPNRRASQDEQEEKLYTMIPLFCKVMYITVVQLTFTSTNVHYIQNDPKGNKENELLNDKCYFLYEKT